MQAAQRTALTKALSGHVATIAADLRKQMLETGRVRDRAKQLHADEKVADDFEVWTDLLSRRAAVLWVLKTVYVRVLEDRGLLRPGRLLDPEAQQLFEKLAPSLGDTAFLSWVFRDLASPHGGLPELFAVQPAEVGVPADALSRALIAFWRSTNVDTGFQWNFATEAFAGELMGDLYQELDPVVKDRYALCQTPDFVRDFMLDQTLMPAITELGADSVRLIDPACGSGHFLLDAVVRLVDATTLQHPEWPRRQVVDHVLDRVVGIDLNDYACAIARVRLVMTAAELAGIANLGDAASFHPHVYWADGLEQIERDEVRRDVQLDFLTSTTDPPPRAVLTRPHVRVALRPMLQKKFQVVVGNPPYITERDDARKAYHREKVGKRRRYLSAYREYSLAAPFTERALQLAESGGWVGLIIGNNFMKREFGKPLIEDVLATVDLNLVVDTSQAFIPHHGTPTVMLFIRSRLPGDGSVRAVMGKRGEPGIPDDPSRGKVWSSIIEGHAKVGFENEFVSVSDVARPTLAKHPWSLGGGGAAELKQALEKERSTIGSVATSIGSGAISGEDKLFLQIPGTLDRNRVNNRRRLVTGDGVRDWAAQSELEIVWPNSDIAEAKSESDVADVLAFFWKFRTVLQGRKAFGRPIEERGIRWWQVREVYSDRFLTRLSIGFAKIATHNHFSLDRGDVVFHDSSPVIKLPAHTSEDDHIALVGILNSSTACFWMKQVFQPKSNSTQRHHPDPERKAFEFAGTGLGEFPLPSFESAKGRLVELSWSVDAAMRARTLALEPGAWTSALDSAISLRARLAARWAEADRQRQRAIFAQEEIDWLVYQLYGLVPHAVLSSAGPQTLPRGQRAFERLLGHRSFVREGGQVVPVDEAEVETGGRDLPREYETVTAERERLIGEHPALGMIENYMHKRHWRDTEDNLREATFRERHDHRQLRAWLCSRLEESLAAHGRPSSLAKLATLVQDNSAFLAVAEVLEGTPSFDLARMVAELVGDAAVANHPFHVYTPSGVGKRMAWEETWRLQRMEDAGERVGAIPIPPTYSQGSRGKSKDFVRDEFWRLRGPLDVHKERFIAFTEMPGRGAGEIIYGWAGWTPAERVRALLVLDEQCEEEGVPLRDRIALLDSAWRLLPDVVREDAMTGARLKAELQALLGVDGPSRVLLDDWMQRFPTPGGRGKTKKQAVPSADEDEDEVED